MTIEEMQQRKRELGLTSEMIAQMSGVPLGTVQKIFAGITKAPRRLTIEALEKVLQKPASSKAADYTYGTEFPENTPVIRETSFQYDTSPKDLRHTLDDYYALPDDRRAELIDGLFYDLAAPSTLHQLILMHLSHIFYDCAKQHDMPCEVFVSPFDVRLDRDDYTIVQPDILILCEALSNLNDRRLEGPPDLAVEILSSSTRSKDMILKLYKYEKAGVREYWIVDPKNSTVTVHYFEDQENYNPKRYTFEDRIPVEITHGDCFIDFSQIQEKLARFESFRNSE